MLKNNFQLFSDGIKNVIIENMTDVHFCYREFAQRPHIPYTTVPSTVKEMNRREHYRTED